MYLDHFGLACNPFSLTPDPRFLFLTAGHREALAALLFAVTERKGFMVMSGEAGTGKTTLIKKLLLSIPSTCAQFSVVVNPALTRSELLEYILLDFGERNVPGSKALRLSLFQRLLLNAHAEGKTSVLVIDEAHLLTAELVDEIRLLSNFETSEQKLLQIILAGQNELNAVLNLESMRHVKQRIAIRTHIGPLTRSEINSYLVTRWKRAHAKVRLPFLPEAIELLAESSGGIPRVINAICDAALVNACGTKATVIGRSEIQEVLRDLAISVGNSPGLVPVPPISQVSSPAIPILRNTKDRSTIPLLERYPSGRSKVSNFWKVATWFRVARSEAE